MFALNRIDFESLHVRLAQIACFLIAIYATSTIAAESPKLILEGTSPQVELGIQGEVNIDALTGNVLVTPSDPAACAAVTSCEDVTVAVESFTVNNASSTARLEISQGVPATFRWGSRGAWECEGTGFPGWTGLAKPPTNDVGQTVSTSLIPTGTYQSLLSCTNGPVEATAGPISITVVEGGSSGGPEQCSAASRQPPPGWNRLSTGTQSCVWIAGVGFASSSDCSTWAGIWDLPFPGGGGDPQRVGIGRQSPNEYLAIELSTANFQPTDDLSIRREGPGSNVTITSSIATISECPGDFDRTSILAETGCYFVLDSILDRIRFGGTDTTRDCKLESNKTYFLNIAHTSSPAGTPSSQLQSNCPSGQFCGVLYNPP
jgi:hypothetical protein